MMFFTWLRNRVREAVLAGLSDAAAEVDAPDSSAAEAVAQLTARLRALPEPADEEDAPTNGREVSRLSRPARAGCHSSG